MYKNRFLDTSFEKCEKKTTQIKIYKFINKVLLCRKVLVSKKVNL